MNRKCFTLAETMVTLAILGVVAVLTVPSLVNKGIESTKRTKIKKAMETYETVLNKIVSENNLRTTSELTTWANWYGDTTAEKQNNRRCFRVKKYFKISENHTIYSGTTGYTNANNCKFKTSDGLWWNVQSITKPYVSFKKEDLTAAKANDANTNIAFNMIGSFDNKSRLRINDLDYETLNNDTYAAYLRKLYRYIKFYFTPFEKCKGNKQQICMVGEPPTKYTYFSSIDKYLAEPINIRDRTGDATSEENCASSSYSYCSAHGDFWNLARKTCPNGTHLLTYDEAKAAYAENKQFFVCRSGAHYTCNYWIDRNYNSDYAYTINSTGGNISPTGKANITWLGEVICVSDEKK